MNTTTPVIALPEAIDPAGIALLTRHAHVREHASLSQMIEARRHRHTDAIVVRSIRIGADVMDALSGLQVIGRHGAGLDNIDLEAARERGITVVNTPQSNTLSVAEYVIGAVYFLVKRFGDTSHALRSGAFTPEGGSLPGQVQRMGLTGREVARLAESHGMRIAFYDPFVDSQAVISAGHERFGTLEALLGVSDVVTLHVPGVPGGPPLISREQLETMKPGAYLVNASRGSNVCLEAVETAIYSGRLAGCAIDVYDEEPPKPRSALFSHPSVLATPHMAAMTREALERMAVDVAAFTLEALKAIPMLRDDTA